jgi:hypothetical protein
MEFVISLAVGLLLYELYAWLPRISEMVLAWAVSTLPPKDRERYREEWLAHLNSLPNTAVRLINALNFCVAALRIRADIVAAQRSEIEGVLDDLSLQNCEHRRVLGALKIQAAEPSRRPIRASLALLESTLASAKASAGWTADQVNTVEAFIQVVTKALNLMWSLMDVRLERAATRIEGRGNRLLTVAKDYEQLERRRLSSGARAVVLQRIVDDLSALKIDIEVDETDDEDRALDRRHHGIVTAIAAATPRDALPDGVHRQDYTCRAACPSFSVR